MMRYIFAILLIFGVSSLAEARRDISELVEVRNLDGVNITELLYEEDERVIINLNNRLIDI